MTEASPHPDERFSRTRTIPASASAIFAVLADPSRHRETEPGDWVRTAIDPEPLTEVGQIFGMNMHAEGTGDDYRMHSTVTVFDPDRAIAWDPGSPTSPEPSSPADGAGATTSGRSTAAPR